MNSKQSNLLYSLFSTDNEQKRYVILSGIAHAPLHVLFYGDYTFFNGSDLLELLGFTSDEYDFSAILQLAPFNSLSYELENDVYTFENIKTKFADKDKAKLINVTNFKNVNQNRYVRFYKSRYDRYEKFLKNEYDLIKSSSCPFRKTELFLTIEGVQRILTYMIKPIPCFFYTMFKLLKHPLVRPASPYEKKMVSFLKSSIPELVFVENVENDNWFLPLSIPSRNLFIDIEPFAPSPYYTLKNLIKRNTIFSQMFNLTVLTLPINSTPLQLIDFVNNIRHFASPLALQD